jgi:hypothetical protein
MDGRSAPTWSHGEQQEQGLAQQQQQQVVVVWSMLTPHTRMMEKVAGRVRPPPGSTQRATTHTSAGRAIFYRWGGRDPYMLAGGTLHAPKE